MMRKYGRTDSNHAEIAAALRKAGASVVSLASVGNGCPDLLVGFRTRGRGRAYNLYAYLETLPLLRTVFQLQTVARPEEILLLEVVYGRALQGEIKGRHEPEFQKRQSCFQVSDLWQGV